MFFCLLDASVRHALTIYPNSLRVSFLSAKLIQYTIVTKLIINDVGAVLCTIITCILGFTLLLDKIIACVSLEK